MTARQWDISESLFGSLLGLTAGTIANYTALPAIWGITPTAGESVQIALFFFAMSFGLRFVTRRIFRKVSK